MTTRRIQAAATAAAAAAVLAVAGCSSSTSGRADTSDSGGSGTAAPSTSSSASASASSSASSSASTSASADPATTVAGAFVAARGATAVRVTGSGRDSGVKIAFDMHYGKSGGKGFIAQGGNRIDLVVTGATTYFKAPAAFWRQQLGAQADQVLALIRGRWVKVPASSAQAKAFQTFGNRQKLLQAFTTGLQDEAGSLRPAGTATVGGVRTTTFRDPTNGDTVDIAASGQPYPLRVVDASATDGGTLTFSDWNKAFAVTAPPASKTFTLPS